MATKHRHTGRLGMMGWALGLVISAMSATTLWADAPVTQPADATITPATQPTAISDSTTAPATTTAPGAGATSQAMPSAQEVIEELLHKRSTAPEVEPAVQPLPTAPVGPMTDRRVLGTAPPAAPGQAGATLRREGQFVINRRGRVTPAAGGQGWLFVFASDGPGEKEPPLLLSPCTLSQAMQDIARRRGDRAVFLVTGQVLTYEGANYLLPSQVSEDFDRGNLKP